jgi:hypothetical protein
LFSINRMLTQSRTFIPRGDVGYTSIIRIWTNIPTAVGESWGCDECWLWRLWRLPESGFICWRVYTILQKLHTQMHFESRVEAESNTSTVTLRVVGDDEKGTQCPCSWGYKYGAWPSRFGESRIWDSKMWSWVLRDSDLRMTALPRTSSNCRRQTRLPVREEAT